MSDLDIRIELKVSPTSDPYFKVPAWAAKFPDSTARPFDANVFYASSWIDRIQGLAADGGRIYIPYPTHDTLRLSPWLHAIARAIDDTHELPAALRQCGIVVEESAAHDGDNA